MVCITHTVQVAELAVTDVSQSKMTTQPGVAFTVTATVQNSGNVSASGMLEITVDGSQIDTQSVSMEPGATADFPFDVTLEELGDYEICCDILPQQQPT